jgi:glycosyltransferase involved in cell wall biosynthesis
MINNFYQIKLFEIILFTINIKEENEYFIPKDIKRIIIKYNNIYKLIKETGKRKIDILIYQFPIYENIEKLNKLKYKSDFLSPSKLFILDILLMDNFISYDYNFIIQSDLSSKTILMIGRASDKLKRFELGIKAMKYIIQEIHNSKLKIISDILDTDCLQNLKLKLNLEKYINFTGYTSTPEIYFKNSSLHIFPSISDCFPMVLCETKVYGIPNFLIGIDYVKMSKGGTIILYDDSPEHISKEAIKILRNYKYRKKLGKEARESMIKFKNESLLNRWVKLILSIFNGEEYYQKFINQDRNISEKNSLNIIAAFD